MNIFLHVCLAIVAFLCSRKVINSCFLQYHGLAHLACFPSSLKQSKPCAPQLCTQIYLCSSWFSSRTCNGNELPLEQENHLISAFILSPLHLAFELIFFFFIINICFGNGQALRLMRGSKYEELLDYFWCCLVQLPYFIIQSSSYFFNPFFLVASYPNFSFLKENLGIHTALFMTLTYI